MDWGTSWTFVILHVTGNNYFDAMFTEIVMVGMVSVMVGSVVRIISRS